MLIEIDAGQLEQIAIRDVGIPPCSPGIGQDRRFEPCLRCKSPD
jgi:hypothetical protein